MAASSKHHVRNRILGGLGAVILVVVGFFYVAEDESTAI